MTYTSPRYGETYRSKLKERQLRQFNYKGEIVMYRIMEQPLFRAVIGVVAAIVSAATTLAMLTAPIV